MNRMTKHCIDKHSASHFIWTENDKGDFTYYNMTIVLLKSPFVLSETAYTTLLTSQLRH